jgi:very-short-patch-repair endonuclease
VILEEAFADFMKRQRSSAVGERLRLLKKERHGETLFLQKVWWPVRRNFDQLDAEVEFRDTNGRVRFADFVYWGTGFKLAMEVDGFDTHVTRMDREKLSDEHDRQNSLTYHGFSIIRFTYDQITQKSADCINFLRLLLRKLEHESSWMNQLTARERWVFQSALRCGERAFGLQEVMKEVGMGEKQLRNLLRKLVGYGWIVTDGNTGRIRSYRINPEVWSKMFWSDSIWD